MLKKLEIDFTYGAVLIIAMLILNNHIGMILPLLAAVSVHELGHAVAILLYKGSIRTIALNAGGLKIDYDSIRFNYGQDIVCAAAGPIAGLSAAIIGSYLNVNVFAGISIVISMFNLLPVRPLDGGRILWNLFMMLFGVNAEKIIRIVEIAVLLLIWVISIYASIYSNGNLSLLTIAAVLTFYYCKER